MVERSTQRGVLVAAGIAVLVATTLALGSLAARPAGPGEGGPVVVGEDRPRVPPDGRLLLGEPPAGEGASEPDGGPTVGLDSGSGDGDSDLGSGSGDSGLGSDLGSGSGDRPAGGG